MRLLIFALSIKAYAAIDGLSVIGATSGQIVISYTAPSTASCKVEASTGSGYTPLAADVDATFFANQDRDTSRTSTLALGRYRVVVVGRLGFAKGLEAVEQATNGYHLSRALHADTEYYIRISDCGDGATATTTGRTATIPWGDTRGERLPAKPGEWFRYLMPTRNTLANPEFADPWTGAVVKQPPSALGYAYSRTTAQFGEGYIPADCNKTLTSPTVKGSCAFAASTGTGWTATSGTLSDATKSDDGVYAQYSGTSQDKLFLRLGSGKIPYHSTFGAQLAWQNIIIRALTSSTTNDGEYIKTCITQDGVNCASPAQRITLTTSEATYRVCSDSPCTTAENPGDVMYDSMDGYVLGKARLYNDTGTLGTLKFAGDATAINEACAFVEVGETLYFYDSRTNGINISSLPITGKDCAASPRTLTTSASLELNYNGTTGIPYWWLAGTSGYRYGVLVWKESTTEASNIQIDIALWRAASAPSWGYALGSGGFGKRCQTVPTAAGYYLCQTSADSHFIIGFRPNASGGLDQKFYGVFYRRADGLNAGLAASYYSCASNSGVNDAMWSDTEPGVFYCLMNGTQTAYSGTGGLVLVKVTLSLADPATPDPDSDVNQMPQAGVTSATILTPALSAAEADDYTILGQMRRYAPTYRSASFPNTALFGVQGKTIIIQAQAGGANDSTGWLFAFDIGNGLPIGSGFVGTQGGNTQQIFGGFLFGAHPQTSWCGIHTYQSPLKLGGATFALPEAGTKCQFAVTGDSSLTACTLGGTCAACPNVTLDGYNYNGQLRCSDLNISSTWGGSMQYEGGTAGVAPPSFVSGDPIQSGCTEQPNLTWYKHLEVGDFLTRNGEVVRVIAKSLPTITVIRGWGAGYDSSTYSPKAHSSSVNWGTWCGAISKDPAVSNPENPLGLAWYYGEDPDANDTTKTFISRFVNHGINVSTFGLLPKYNYAVYDLDSPTANAATLTTGGYIQQPATFAGQDNSCPGNACETHPAATQVAGDTVAKSSFADVHPRLFHIVGTNGVALTSGKTFIYEYTGDSTLYPHHMDIEVYSGKFPFVRADTITDAASDTGKFCVAIVANDCFSGSTAGKVYVVFSIFDTTFIALATCRESQFGTNNVDLCVGNSNGGGAVVAQYQLPTTNTSVLNGRNFRAVAKAHRQYREAATENVKVDPLGRALFARADYYYQVPRIPGTDTRNRSTFTAVPVTVTTVPAGTNNALVQFGYNASFQCSANRDNTCYAEAATVNETTPYKFDHQTLTGLACGSGCTIAIPALSNRVLYWRMVFRDSGGNVISRGATNVQTVN